MNTIPQSQTTPIVQGPTPIQSGPPSPPQKRSIIPLLISVVVILLIIALSLGAYIMGRTTMKKQAAATPTPPAMTPYPTPIASDLSPTIPAAFPTSTDGQTFISQKLGIGFHYTTKGEGTTRDESVHTLETGNKVYVYAAYMKPETGQSIEMFEKPASEPLKTAIEKRFLTGIDPKECFVTLDPDPKSPKNILKASIDYPVPTDAEEPAFTFGDLCPENYRSSNGMAYFMEDTNYPDRFYYLSIGQYLIPGYDHTPDRGWHQTITVLPRTP